MLSLGLGLGVTHGSSALAWGPWSMADGTTFYADDVALADGTPFASWSSRSGLAAHRSAPGEWPTYGATALAGQPAVVFGGSHGLQIDSTMGIVRTWTIMAVLQYTALTAGGGRFAAPGVLFSCGNPSTNEVPGRREIYMVGVGEPTDGLATLSAESWIVGADAAGNYMTINGVAQTMSNASLKPASDAVAPAAIGAAISSGSLVCKSSVRIGVITFLPRKPTAGEVALWLAWVAAKYGV